MDAVDGSIRMINYGDREDEELETTGVFYLPGYRKCLDVIRFSDNNFSIMPYKSIDKSLDNFSECGFFIETKDAYTNTMCMERRQIATNTEPLPPPTPPSPKSPIIVTFLQSPKITSGRTTEATTNTPRTAIYDVTRIKQDRDSGYRGSLVHHRNSRDVDCSTQTDVAMKYSNVDRVRSAILVELLSLQKLCQRSKLICDDPLFQENHMLNACKDVDYYNENETESICDGLSSVIAEIFNILPNMFSEDTRHSRQLSAYYSDTDIGYEDKPGPISSGGGVKQSKPKEQLVFLREYLRNRKKAVDKELLHVAYTITVDRTDTGDCTEFPKGSDVLLEQKIIEGLMEKLSGRSLLPTSSLDELKKLLNIILCDHTITACLLALTQKQNLYYYNYNETEFDLMSNSTIESGDFNVNTRVNGHTIYPYPNGTEEWTGQRIPRTPDTIDTYDIDAEKRTREKQSRGLNKLLCMPFKSKVYKNLRGKKPK